MNEYSKEYGVVLGFTLGILFSVVLTLAHDVNKPSEKDRCDAVDGIYLIIGQEYSPATKSTIDVYGCVKGSGT